MTEKEKKALRQDYLYKGVTVFLVVAACVVFFFIIYKIGTIFSFIGRLISVLQPLIFGLVIAYLVNPFAEFVRRHTKRLLNKRFKNAARAEQICNAAGVFSALLLFVLIIFTFFYLVIPQFVASITNIVNVLPGQVDAWIAWVEKLLESDDRISGWLIMALDYGSDWLETEFTPQLALWAGYFASSVMNVLTFFKNFVIGMIFTMYLMFHKQLYERQTRKLLYAVLKPRFVERLLRMGQRAHAIFSGFINGKLLDSLIIGILCFIGVSILRIPYTMLVAVIVGVTNIIPVFGPYIGAVPCAALILLTDPMKGLYFIIFIIILQAVDGNIIGPKILGTKTGIATFWVVFAIVLGGGMFGVFGMLIGVPTFAVFYYLLRTFINNRLAAKKLPLESEYYDNDVIERMNGTGSAGQEE